MADDGWGNDGWGADDGAQAATAPAKRGCFRCGEEGHNKANCPKPDDRPKGCFNCGQEGHNKADCPNPSVAKKRACFKCGEEGHSKADCPSAGGDDAPPRKSGCFKCGEEGHNRADCPQAGDDDKPRGCFKCGKEGHSKADCPEPDVCRNCGEEGHLAKDCTKEAETRTVKDKDGKDVEIYVPKEVADDSLFKMGIRSGINFDKFDRIEKRVTGSLPTAPVETFEEACLRKLLLENILKSGYLKPTPIQKCCIPAVLAKRDFMACAQTGSGKTAAFMLPILHYLLENGCAAQMRSVQTPEALVIAPTRELAIQIKEEARKFAYGSMLKCVVAYGGTSTMYQSTLLANGCNVLIGTPGRLKDFVSRGKVSFEKLKFLVLDEADRLLDMGFVDDIREITKGGNMPPKGERVTTLFSATFPQDVQQLADEYLENYLFFQIGIVGAANEDVTQTIYEVQKFSKREKLVEVVGQAGSARTLVFVETQKNCDFIGAFLCNEGFPTTTIHGARLQREREIALNDFKSGKMRILVATDVAARGLDIQGVEHVINFDLPDSIDQYVHRIGRTGRVGNLGRATSFFDPGDEKNLKIAADLVKILSDAKQEVPDFLANMGGGASGGLAIGGFGTKDIRQDAEVMDGW